MSRQQANLGQLPGEILLAISEGLYNLRDINALVKTNRRCFHALNRHLYRELPKLRNLPNEILLAIAEKLENLGDINAFAQTNRRLFRVVNVQLYRHDALFGALEALDWAASRGYLNTAQMSINACDPNNQNHIDTVESVLYYAAECGHADVVSCLLQLEGVDPNYDGGTFGGCSCDPGTALNGAAGLGHTEVVKILLSCEGINANPQPASKISPLSTAAYGGYTEIVELLLDVPGIDADYHDPRDRTPLFYAVLSKSPEVVSSFLRRGDLKIDVNVKDRIQQDHLRKTGRTPLIVASQFESADIANLLLNVPGIDINQSDNWGKTALHFAAELGAEDIVRALLQHHADPDPKDQDNETPLFLAAKNGSLPVVKMLLDAGADPNHICNNQVHPLGAARTEGHREIAQLIRDLDGLDLSSLGPVPRNWNAARGKMWRHRYEEKENTE